MADWMAGRAAPLRLIERNKCDAISPVVKFDSIMWAETGAGAGKRGSGVSGRSSGSTQIPTIPIPPRRRALADPPNHPFDGGPGGVRAEQAGTHRDDKSDGPTGGHSFVQQAEQTPSFSQNRFRSDLDVAG